MNFESSDIQLTLEFRDIVLPWQEVIIVLTMLDVIVVRKYTQNHAELDLIIWFLNYVFISLLLFWFIFLFFNCHRNIPP